MNTRTSLCCSLLAATLLLGVGCPKPKAEPSLATPGEQPALAADPSTPQGLSDPGDVETPPRPDSGQAPAAAGPETPQATYAGYFVGDGLTVWLSGADGHYEGTLDFQGKTFPATGREDGSGLLQGTFKSKGRAFDYSALLEGDSMSFKSSNKTYELQRMGQKNLLAEWGQSGEGEARDSFAGGFSGRVLGTPATLDLKESDQTVLGTLVVNGHSYRLDGTRTALAVLGKLDDPTGGGVYPFEMCLGQGGSVRLSIVAPGDMNGRMLLATFKRR